MNTDPSDASFNERPRDSVGAASAAGQKEFWETRRRTVRSVTALKAADRLESRSSAISGSESISSMLRRLGAPPPDIVDHLVQQFHTACKARISNGEKIGGVRVENCYITERGEFLLGRSDDLREEIPVDLETLTGRFREHLAGPPPAAKSRRILSAVSRRVSVVAERLERHRVVETETTQLSLAEQVRRDALAQKFTKALIERFGFDAIDDPLATPNYSRAVRLRSMVRDQRFNWNLAMGIATAVAVAALVMIGIHVANGRQRRAEMESSSPTLAPVQSERISNPVETMRSTTEPVELPGKPLPAPPASPAKSSEQIKASLLWSREPSRDLVEELETLKIDRSRTEKPAGWVEKPSDGLIKSTGSPLNSIDATRLRLPSDVPLGMKLGSKVGDPFFEGRDEIRTGPIGPQSPEAAAEESIDWVLIPNGLDDGIPESPQRIRSTERKFVQLPPRRDTGTRVTVGELGGAIRRIEFPVELPIAFAEPNGQDSAELINQRNGNTIARLTRKSGRTGFQWSENAQKESPAAQMVHGRLIDAAGESVFLRPSIETDPLHLSIDRKEMRPSWELDGPILRNASQLEIDLSVPPNIHLDWIRPFNSTRPSDGSAVALLTPTNRETVAILVQVKVKCSSRLTCEMQYAARLDPNLPWHALTKEGFEQANRIVESRLVNLAVGPTRSDWVYAGSDEATRLRIKRQQDLVNQQREELESASNRLEMLSDLVSQMESSVTLKMHLFVRWPDARQTILRTTDPNPESAK
jgi:hypothetical protein